MTDMIFTLMNWDNKLPAMTPMALVSTRAEPDARKTSHLLAALSAANNIVTSWVLSAISAMNTLAKIAVKSFHSMSMIPVTAVATIVPVTTCDPVTPWTGLWLH